MPPLPSYQKHRVESLDGTAIGYRRLGDGPAVMLVHGGSQGSQHYMKLAARLAARFTVIVPDRRGRGMSGDHGPRYCMEREVEDLQAVQRETGATAIFGSSSGALAALATARATPALARVALFEPPLPVDETPEDGWVVQVEREIAAGDPIAALCTMALGLELAPGIHTWPRTMLRQTMEMAVARPLQGPDDVPLLDLVPTQVQDFGLVRAAAAATLDRWRDFHGEVLLLGGDRSPRFLQASLDALERTLPRAGRCRFPRLGHSAPDDTGNPRAVADALLLFFGEGLAAVPPSLL